MVPPTLVWRLVSDLLGNPVRTNLNIFLFAQTWIYCFYTLILLMTSTLILLMSLFPTWGGSTCKHIGGSRIRNPTWSGLFILDTIFNTVCWVFFIYLFPNDNGCQFNQNLSIFSISILNKNSNSENCIKIFDFTDIYTISK